LVVSDVDACEENSRSACLEEGELTMHQSTLQNFAQPNTTPVGSGYLSLDNVYIADIVSFTGMRLYVAQKHCDASIILGGKVLGTPSGFDTEASGDEGKSRFVGFVNISLVVLDVDAFEESSVSECLGLSKLTTHQSTLQDFAQPNTTHVGSGYLLLGTVYIVDTISSTDVRAYVGEKQCKASKVLSGKRQGTPSRAETKALGYFGEKGHAAHCWVMKGESGIIRRKAATSTTEGTLGDRGTSRFTAGGPTSGRPAGPRWGIHNFDLLSPAEDSGVTSVSACQ
jgi:hypothetical protein